MHETIIIIACLIDRSGDDLETWLNLEKMDIFDINSAGFLLGLF